MDALATSNFLRDGTYSAWQFGLNYFDLAMTFAMVLAYGAIAGALFIILYRGPEKRYIKALVAAQVFVSACALDLLLGLALSTGTAVLVTRVLVKIVGTATGGFIAGLLWLNLSHYFNELFRKGLIQQNKDLRNEKILLKERIAKVRQQIEALSSTAAQKSELFEASSDAIMIREADDRISYWNKGAMTLYGYTAKEAVGLVPQKLLKTKYPGGETSDSIRVHHNWQGELRHTCRDGREVTVMSRWVTQRDDEAHPSYTLEINTDISAQTEMLEVQKQHEIRYQCLFNSGMIGVLIADAEGRLHEANDTFLRWMGYTQEELPTLRWVDLTPDRWRHVDEKIRKDLHDMGRSTHNEKEYVRKDGSFLAVHLGCAYLESSNLILCTISDVHNQRRVAELLEETVRDRTAQLSASNKELEAFCYSVSHDLRAPLRAIQGFSDILLQRYAEPLGKQGQDYLRRVRNGASRMSSLIDDLLALSRLTRRTLHLERVDVTALADTVVDTLAAMEPARTVKVDVQRGMVAQADAILLFSVMQNLIGNAWKFSSKKTVAEVSVGHRTQDDGSTAFFVSDNGVGFDMAHAQKLFSAFQRLHLRSEFEGTGVGLASVQRIVHRHGGRVWAQSNPDGGAIFRFTLTPKRGVPT
jgi:PAS domain S-box-containing protein